MVQWGTVGEWVGGLAALVPLAFWFIERRERIRAQRAEREVTAQAAREAERAQAQAVVAWVTDADRFALVNNSSLPVFDVRALWLLEDSSGGPPTVSGIDSWEALAPGERIDGDTFLPAGVLTCFVQFSDAAGRTWVRSSYGELQPAPGGPSPFEAFNPHWRGTPIADLLTQPHRPFKRA